MSKKTPYLDRLRDKFGVGEDALQQYAETQLGAYFKPVVDMILASPKTLENASHEWDFKSLHQFAMEEFAGDTPLVALVDQLNDGPKEIDMHRFMSGAASQYGSAVKDWLYYIPEGIELYWRKSDGEYAVADETSLSWQLVSLLIANGVDLDDEMVAPPQWALDLYVKRENYDAYRSIYHDIDMLHPLYEFSRKLRRDAVLAQSRGLLNTGTTAVELPPELSIALEAFHAVRGNEELLRRKTPKQALTKWLKDHHESLSEGALERIATIANWQPAGGAPKQEG